MQVYPFYYNSIRVTKVFTLFTFASFIFLNQEYLFLNKEYLFFHQEYFLLETIVVVVLKMLSSRIVFFY